MSNGVGWEPRNNSTDSNADNRDHQRPNMGHIHPAMADGKHLPDNRVTSPENEVGFNHKYLNNNTNGTAVHIDIPNSTSVPSSNDKIRIPQEKFKTFVGKYFVMLFFY